MEYFFYLFLWIIYTIVLCKVSDIQTGYLYIGATIMMFAAPIYIAIKEKKKDK